MTDDRSQEYQLLQNIHFHFSHASSIFNLMNSTPTKHKGAFVNLVSPTAKKIKSTRRFFNGSNGHYSVKLR